MTQTPRALFAALSCLATAVVTSACPTPIGPEPTPMAPTEDAQDPSDPSDPSDPADPSDPDEPSEPNEPSDPSDPDEPNDPDEPSDPDEPTPCSYPSSGSLTGVGDVMPRLVWSDARHADGSTFSFDLLDAHCDDSISGIVFILSAAWCPSCPSYVADVAAQANQIEAAGGLLVFLELQDLSYGFASNADAQQVISGWAGTTAGIRVGDGGSDHPGLVNESTIWSAVPGGFLVRRSDMQVMVNQDTSPYVIDWASELEALGGGGGGGGGGECADEPSEPNDQTAAAAAIGPGTFSAAICGPDADYYSIDLAGEWQLELDFSHAAGDIDVTVVDENGTPLLQGGSMVGSESADDDESFTWHDPAIVKVYGYQGARNSYVLTLSGSTF